MQPLWTSFTQMASACFLEDLEPTREWVMLTTILTAENLKLDAQISLLERSLILYVSTWAYISILSLSSGSLEQSYFRKSTTNVHVLQVHPLE